jgi:GDP-L-fucose synthase
MTKLITGGGGLVGSEFKDGYKVSTKDYNLLCEKLVNEMYIMYAPDVVIHTAAKVGGVKDNMNNLAEYFRHNVIINNNVIHYAYKYGVKKLICFLSTCVFPDNVIYPLTEDKIHLGEPHSSNYGYAYAKRMVDIQLRAYNDQYGTKYFSVIPTNIYGKNDNYDLESSHVIPALIRKCYVAIQSSTDFVVWGSGKPLREFIYAEDVANICNILIDKYEDTKPLILSTSEEISISDVAHMIADIMGFKGNIIFDTTKPDGQFRKPTDNANLLKVIGDYKFTPLEEGLKKTIQHFLEKQK